MIVVDEYLAIRSLTALLPDDLPDEPLAVTTSAQNAFNSGSTGADGALAFYAPPPGRGYHAMAYDAVRQRVVLFGGSNTNTILNDTWEYDGTTWTQRTPATSPSARGAHAMAYDAARDVTGQVFGTRMNEIYLFSSPRPIRSLHRADGWTPEAIAEHALPALQSSFMTLDRSGDVFSWDPL